MHGNDNNSKRKHILYVIIEGLDTILKFGISSEKNEKPGSELDRPKAQVRKFNKRNQRLGLPSVTFRILFSGIITRRLANLLERLVNHIYHLRHGEYPPEEDKYKKPPNILDDEN